MAKKAYIGVDGVARKIKKGYIGVDGVARKIKKAYIGIGGVARPCWSGGDELASYGTITAWDEPRYHFAATSIGNYALFGGGCNSWYSNSYSDRVDVYNSSLVQSTKTLSQARDSLAATAVGNYAFFAGGYNNGYSAVTDAFDSSLTRTNPAALAVKRSGLAATTVGNYALFGGGETSEGDYAMYMRGYCTAVDAYSSSLTHHTPEHFYGILGDTSAATVGDYAIFAGVDYENSGGDEEETGGVEAYNSSLTQVGTSIASHNIQRGMSTATVGDYAIFAGGYVNVFTDEGEIQQNSSMVIAVNKSLTSSYLSDLSACKQGMGSTSLGNYAIFAGGADTEAVYYDEEDGSSSYALVSRASVDIYDASLTKLENLNSLAHRKHFFAAASVGDYAIFPSGYFTDNDGDGGYSSLANEVEAFTLV